MDTHERPYRCSEPLCGKEFTSSSVFLRHKKEMHNNGSKPRPSFLCPFEGCSRHSRPFTRLENLKKHERDCHRRKANSCPDGRENISSKPDPLEHGSRKSPNGDSAPATCLSPDQVLQTELNFLHTRLVQQDQCLEELEQRKMELEAMNLGSGN